MQKTLNAWMCTKATARKIMTGCSNFVAYESEPCVKIGTATITKLHLHAIHAYKNRTKENSLDSANSLRSDLKYALNSVVP